MHNLKINQIYIHKNPHGHTEIDYCIVTKVDEEAIYHIHFPLKLKKFEGVSTGRENFIRPTYIPTSIKKWYNYMMLELLGW